MRHLTGGSLSFTMRRTAFCAHRNDFAVLASGAGGPIAPDQPTTARSSGSDRQPDQFRDSDAVRQRPVDKGGAIGQCLTDPCEAIGEHALRRTRSRPAVLRRCCGSLDGEG
ncbi:hypothetical protein AQI94_33035 [Streptomyces pseudovenezuelae]|uniref:Uncharacterized protein n=1 Tax=Streptomyces pseudovenezuelae TaxID=67350 RepID=A0A101N083_9ACTN|nr:hypothetical protein AQI94_33035 [Streptomyces pseudovenezuelae]